MRVISRKPLREHWERWPDSEQALKSWLAEARHAEWKSSADVKAKYGNASIVNSERVVLNICGNKYRLVVHINYSCSIVFIRFVGTHSEYGKIDVETI